MSALAKTEQLIATLTITEEELATANKLLQMDSMLTDSFEGEELFEKSAAFEDGFEVDLNIYNDDGGPWYEIVLFDQTGANVAQTEALSGSIEDGEAYCLRVDGIEYVLMVDTTGEAS